MRRVAQAALLHVTGNGFVVHDDHFSDACPLRSGRMIRRGDFWARLQAATRLQSRWRTRSAGRSPATEPASMSLKRQRIIGIAVVASNPAGATSTPWCSHGVVEYRREAIFG